MRILLFQSLWIWWKFMTVSMLDHIRLIETLAMNAWPAEEVEMLDGWRLRFSWGVTRRANSVWPNRTRGQHPLNEKLDAVEAFYAARNLPARYQICPAQIPADLDQMLAARGYVEDASTQVQTATADRVLANIAQTNMPADWTIDVPETFGATWFATYREAEQFGITAAEVRQAILRRIALPAGFALLQIGNEPVALGLGVLEAGHLGIFSMATRPDFRRRGAATAILGALVQWAQARGATQVYLQVMDSNRPAQRLYAGLGFKTLYRYHYREASAS